MGYDYQQERPYIFTERGQIRFLRVRDKVQVALKQTGAFRLMNIGIAAWEDIACIDRMVELGELVELKRECWGQFRVFTTPEVYTS